MDRTIRVSRELRMPTTTTISMPSKRQTDDEAAESRQGQGRPVLQRYRLQVDRQTKSSFDDKSAAEKAGIAIKKAHPVVEVTLYDAETETRMVLQV